MKKISALLFTILLAVFGIVLTACGEDKVPELILEPNSVVIYLGETEDNSATVNVKLVNINVSALLFSYDNSIISVTSSKLRDGSFDVTVKALTAVSSDEIKVGINANGKVEAELSVVIVSLPVSIEAEQEI